MSFEAESEDIDGGISPSTSRCSGTAASPSRVHTFANTINTHEGGTHEEGFRAALTSLVNNFARDWNILKEKDANLTGDDVREGLTAIVSVKLAEPQFEGQTKTKLGNTEAKSFVQKVVNDRLGEWFEQNPTEGKEIARKASQRRRPPGSLLARPATWRAAARVCSAAAACPASSPTASRPTPRSASSSSSRATRPAARPSRAATSGSRRSCRSAARSSTSRRRASTASCRTTRCRRIISALGTGIQRRVRHRPAALPQDRADGRRRRRRPAHPHPAAHAAVPLHAPMVEQGHVYLAQPPLYKIKWSRPADAGVRLLRPRARRPDRGRSSRRAASCPRTTASSATRVSAR